MSRWLEEGQEIHTHPRDPYARVDVLATDRHITISLGGELLAETDRALAVFETSLPTRWYLPIEDVRAALTPSDSTSRCPYKGEAHYYSVAVPEGEDGHDLVWYYPEPYDEVRRIKDLVCFFNEKVDIELDGEPQPRGEGWSGAGGIDAAARSAERRSRADARLNGRSRAERVGASWRRPCAARATDREVQPPGAPDVVEDVGRRQERDVASRGGGEVGAAPGERLRS